MRDKNSAQVHLRPAPEHSTRVNMRIGACVPPEEGLAALAGDRVEVVPERLIRVRQHINEYGRI